MPTKVIGNVGINRAACIGLVSVKLFSFTPVNNAIACPVLAGIGLTIRKT